MLDPKTLTTILNRLAEQRPLIHNITNRVAANLSANALLAVGAAPVMSHALAEVEDTVDQCHGLVINLGTLHPEWIPAMHRAVERARQRDIPVVLDPVGVGGTRHRSQVAADLLANHPPSLLRANPSEILALTQQGRPRGVDSTAAADTAVAAAMTLCRDHGCTVVISGTEDYIVHDSGYIVIQGGHPLMARVSGLGCTASVLVAALAAVADDSATGASAAMVLMAWAGAEASRSCAGPGSFVPMFLDALYQFSGQPPRGPLPLVYQPIAASAASR